MNTEINNTKLSSQTLCQDWILQIIIKPPEFDAQGACSLFYIR